jgi:activating signal cointegrator 1
MTYLLDTDILSNLMKPSPSLALIRRLASVPAEQQFVSSISLGELVYGAHRATARTAFLLQQINRVVLPNLPILPFDAHAARRGLVWISRVLLSATRTFASPPPPWYSDLPLSPVTCATSSACPTWWWRTGSSDESRTAMKAITLHQPYATLIAVGAKRIETRGWRTRYRGPLAIHAARVFGHEARALCCREPFRAALARGGYADPAALPLGAVVAICRLVDCLLTGAVGGQPSPHVPPGDTPEWAFGNYAPGRYLWLLEDIAPVLPPRLARGKQGFWEWREATAGKLHG